MVLATKSDITKREKKLKSLMNKLDKTGLSEEKHLISILRSEIRKTWMRHPTKLAYLEQGIYPDKNPATRTKWLCDCEICKEPKKLGDIEIDHMKGEHSFKSLKDLEGFAKSILHVGFKDLQRVCKECHSIKTYSERYGVTFEQAKKEKQVIEWLKLPAPKQKAMLTSKGFKPSEMSNADKRRESFRKLLTSNS